MKFLLILLLAMPLASFAQSKRDYNRTMEQFVRFYNNDDVNGICLLMQPEDGRECFWKNSGRDLDPLKKFGKILHYEYLGKVPSDPADVTAFKVVLEKEGVKVISFNLQPNRYIGTFRFWTTDDEIEEMLAKANRSW